MPEANSMPDLMNHHVTVFTAKTNRKGRFPADTANITPAAKKISFLQRKQSAYINFHHHHHHNHHRCHRLCAAQNFS